MAMAMHAICMHMQREKTSSQHYLRCCGDGFDHVRNEGPDLRQVLAEQGEAVVVDPELAHEEERVAELAPALISLVRVVRWWPPHSDWNHRSCTLELVLRANAPTTGMSL